MKSDATIPNPCLLVAGGCLQQCNSRSHAGLRLYMTEESHMHTCISPVVCMECRVERLSYLAANAL